MTDGRNYSTQIRCGEPMDSIRAAYMDKGYLQEVRYSSLWRGDPKCEIILFATSSL